MRIGKIVVTIACSLLMSGVALAKIVPTPANSPALGLSVASERISAVGDNYGKASSILRSFYDSSIGQTGIEEQTPVYTGENYAGAQNQVANAICNTPYRAKWKLAGDVPLLDGKRSQNKSLIGKIDASTTKNESTVIGAIGGTGAAVVAVVSAPIAVAVVAVVAVAVIVANSIEEKTEENERKYRDGTPGYDAAREEVRRKQEERNSRNNG